MKKTESILVAVFLVILLTYAHIQIKGNVLQAGEVRPLTNEEAVLRVDEVEFNEDGLSIFVTNTGNEDLWISASGLNHTLEHTLMKNVEGKWTEVAPQEDVGMFAIALPAKPDETYAVTVDWNLWYGGKLEPGTYRLASEYWSFDSDERKTEHMFEFMFGL